MEKLKTICRWGGVDGLLPFLVCYGMMLAITPIGGQKNPPTNIAAASTRQAMKMYLSACLSLVIPSILP